MSPRDVRISAMAPCPSAVGESGWTYRAYISGEGWVSGQIVLLSDGQILNGLDIRCEDPQTFGAIIQAAMLALHDLGEITITSMGEPALEPDMIRINANGDSIDDLIERERALKAAEEGAWHES